MSKDYLLLSQMNVYQRLVCILMFFIVGCDWQVRKHGRVFSNENGKPIANVQIRLADTDNVVMTDSLGYFDLWCVGGGKLPEQSYVATKEGYKNFEIELDQSAERTLITVKGEKYSYDLKGRSFYTDSLNKLTQVASIEFDKNSKDFAVRGDSLVLYLDLDNPELDFKKYVKGLKSVRWILE